jgi:hypothetical protein
MTNWPLTPLGTSLVVLGVLLGLWLTARADDIQIKTCYLGFQLALVHPAGGGSELEVEECVEGLWVKIGTIPIKP